MPRSPQAAQANCCWAPCLAAPRWSRTAPRSRCNAPARCKRTAVPIRRAWDGRRRSHHMMKARKLEIEGKTTCEKRMLIGCEVKYSGFGWILATSGRLWGFEPIFGKLMVFDGSCRETTTWWERFGWELTENGLQTESALLTNNPTTISRNFPPKKHYPILRRKTMVN